MFKWIVAGLAAVIVIAVGAWWYEIYRARSALLEQPVYQVIRKHDPALFDELANEYQVFLRDESTREEFVNFANDRINETATRALARASQESVLALVHDMVGTARKLQAAPGEACFRFWFPKVEGPPDISRLVDANAQAHTLGLMGEVIRSAAEQPQPVPDPGSVKANLAQIINDVYAQYGADAQMLGHADDPQVDRGKVCDITISVYERILRLSPAEASALIRTMAPPA